MGRGEFEPLEPRLLLAAEMLADFNTSPASSSPANFVAFDGSVYFTAAHPDLGTRLWVSDGTTTGTRPAAEVNPALAGLMSLASPVILDDDLYFLAQNKLWRTDGTAAGTAVIDAPAPSSSAGLTAFQGKVYFVAVDSEAGTEPWAFDPASGAAARLADVNPGPGGSFPGQFTVAGDRLYFAAATAVHGIELWTTDGTEAGADMVADLSPGTASAGPASLVAAGDRLFFTAQAGGHRQVFTTTDGTEATTTQLTAITSFSSSVVGGLAVLGGEAYFVAGGTLWRTDGTPGGLAAVTGGLAQGLGIITSATPGGRIYLAAPAQPRGGGAGLWASDGTAGGMVQVSPSPESPTGGIAVATTAADDRLFFREHAGSGSGLTTLLRATDGTVAGTATVMTAGNTSPGMGVAALPDGTFLVAGLRPDVGGELFRFDAATGGVSLVRDIHAGTLSSSFPIQWRSGDALYLHNLWRTEGTPETTHRLAVTLPPAAVRVAQLGDVVLFNGTRDGVVDVLWRTDGTPEGSGWVMDAAAKPYAGAINTPGAVVGRKVFFTAIDGQGVRHLYETDLTAAGTRRVTGEDGAYFRTTNAWSSGVTFPFKGKFAFHGTLVDGISESTGLWFSDGTVAGSVALPAPGLDMALAVGDTLYFTYWSQLWKTDGTEAGTMLVKDLAPGETIRGIWQIMEVGGRLFFAGRTPEHGYELWTSDGTPAGTRMLADAFPGQGGGVDSNSPIVAFNGLAYYYAMTDPVYPTVDLWRSDGTPAGTFKAMGPSPLDGAQRRGGPVVAGGRLFLSHGDGLYVSDGTTAGTHRLTGADRPAMPAAATALLELNDALLFTGSTPHFGTELWRLPFSVLDRPIADAGGPYAVAAAGGSAELDASASADPDPADPLTFAWDLDGDGLFGEAGAAAARGDETGPRPTFRADGLTGPSAVVVTVRATDSVGLSAEDSARIVIGGPGMTASPDALYETTSAGPTAAGNALRISSGTVKLTADLSLAAVEVAAGASLDVGDRELLLAMTAADVSALVRSGRLVSSAAEAGRSLGYRTLAAGGVLVKVTPHGDANLDGRVDAADYHAIDRGFALRRALYEEGDLDHDGEVGPGDYLLIDAAFLRLATGGATGGGGGGGGAAALAAGEPDPIETPADRPSWLADAPDPLR